MHMVVNGREIDRNLARANAQSGSRTDVLGTMRRSQQGLGRDTAGIETVAPHKALFDQNRIGPQLGGARCHGQTARPGADHADICGNNLRTICGHGGFSLSFH